MSDASTDAAIPVGETSAGPGAGDIPAGEPVSLLVEEVLQGRGAIFGKSGSGKSNNVSVIVEELLDAGYPACIFDADGEYVSLKEEFEILHVGGDEFCERVVGPEHADALAQLGIDQREPIILDLGGYAEDDADATDDEVTRDEMVRAVTAAFFDRASKAKREGRGVPYLLVAEEIHEYVPQQGGLTPGGAKLVKVAKRGRSRGLGVVGISQRPAAVDKDFITQCDWLCWNRLTWDNDTNVAGRILGSEYKDAVEDLADGEAFLQTDWDEQIRRVQFRRRRTTDLGEAPGLDGAAEVELKETDTSVLDELDTAAAQARTKQQQIDRLREQLKAVREERDDWQERYEDAEYLADVSAEVTSSQLESLFAGAGLEGAEVALETATVEINGDPIEVPEVIRADVLEIREQKRELEDAVAEKDARIEDLEARVDELEQYETIAKRADHLEDLRDDVTELIQRHENVLDLETGGQVEKLQRRIRALEEEKEDLEERIPEEFTEVSELLAHDLVQEVIDEAAAESRYADEHTWDVVTALAGAEYVTVDQVEPYVDVGRSSTNEILRELEEAGIASSEKNRNQTRYRLDEDALRARIDTQRKREEIKRQRKDLRGETS
jgi:predicted  nucleic acid-binding Zn-ribbon protein